MFKQSPASFGGFLFRNERLFISQINWISEVRFSASWWIHISNFRQIFSHWSGECLTCKILTFEKNWKKPYLIFSSKENSFYSSEYIKRKFYSLFTKQTLSKNKFRKFSHFYVSRLSFYVAQMFEKETNSNLNFIILSA